MSNAIHRRDFLKTAGLTAASLSVGGATLPAQPPRVAYAERLDVAVWPPARVDRVAEDVDLSEGLVARK